MSSNWKYGLIKVAIEDEGADYEAQINLLVELYPLGDNGEHDSFCLARLQSIEEIQHAQKDIEHDGINEWFYDNGVFEWKVCNNCAQGDWNWIPSKRMEEKENIKLRSLCRKAAEQVIDDHKETLQKLADNPYPYKHLKEDCVAYQEGGMGCPDCYCDSSCKDDSCPICGGNTPERVEEQTKWLEKIAKQKEEKMINKLYEGRHPLDPIANQDLSSFAIELKKENIELRSLYEQVISRINKLDDDTREAKGHLNILVLDRFLADITKLVGE